MKMIKFLNYPDLVGSLFFLLFLFLTMWGWPESQRPLIEFVPFFVIGVSLGQSGKILDRYFRNKLLGEQYVSKHKFLIQSGGILYLILVFLTIYVPMQIKYWIFSLMTGYLGLFVISLLVNEIISKKRYQWNDFKT